MTSARIISRLPDTSQHCMDRSGMSLKKAPAEKVRTKRQLPPESWEIEYGAYRENLRLCFLPTDEEEHGYWFGFESEIQKIQPVFKAKKLS